MNKFHPKPILGKLGTMKVKPAWLTNNRPDIVLEISQIDKLPELWMKRIQTYIASV